MIPKKKASLPFEIIEIIEIILIVFALSWFTKTYLLQFVQVGDKCMLPTLNNNSIVFIDKFFAQKLNIIKRGDIVAYCPADSKKTEIKRLVGLPGDKVEIRNGYTYVNGEPCYEPYAQISVDYVFKPVIIPDGHFFVLNDNRSDNFDSRIIGPIPIQSLDGKALFTIWPLLSIKSL